MKELETLLNNDLYLKRSSEFLSQLNSHHEINNLKHIHILNSLIRDHFTTYKSYLNPFYSYLSPNLESMEKFSLLTMRDGLFHLFFLFIKNPTPPTNLFFLFKEELRSLIPKNWFSQAYFFNYIFYDRGLNQEASDLILYLDLDEAIAPLSDLESIMLSIKSHPFITKKTHIKMIIREDHNLLHPCRSADKMVYTEEVLSLLRQALGERLIFLDHERALSNLGPSAYYVHLNPKLFFTSDSFLEHMLMSHGVCPLNIPLSCSHAQVIKKGANHCFHSKGHDHLNQEYRLSPHHGIRLRQAEQITEESQLRPGDILIDKAKSLMSYYSEQGNHELKNLTIKTLLSPDYIKVAKHLAGQFKPFI